MICRQCVNVANMNHGVTEMNNKSLKTFNLRRTTIDIVRTKPNQSEFVDRAIIKLHKKQEEFTIDDMETRAIAIRLKNRDDCPRHLSILIHEWLYGSS